MKLIDMRNEVLNRGFDPIVFSSRVNNYLNDAQSLIARRCDYYEDEATQAITTVAAQTTYAWPTDFARARSLYDSDRQTELQYVSLRDIDRARRTNGQPVFYAIDGPNIHLHPVPDGAYNLVLRYWKMPSALVNDTDAPIMPADWHHILCDYATWRCYEDEDDAQMGGYWMGMWDRQLAMFLADQKFPSSDGPNQARGMWDSEPQLSPAGAWSLYGGW